MEGPIQPTDYSLQTLDLVKLERTKTLSCSQPWAGWCWAEAEGRVLLEEGTAWQRLGAAAGQCVDGEHCSLAELSSRKWNMAGV